MSLTKREKAEDILNLYHGDIHNITLAKRLNTHLLVLIQTASRVMVPSLATPFKAFIPAYNACYNITTDNLCTLQIVYDQFPALLATVKNEKHFHAQMHSMFRIVSTIRDGKDEYEAFEKAFKDMVSEIVDTAGKLSVQPAHEESRARLSNLYGQMSQLSEELANLKAKLRVYESAKGRVGEIRSQLTHRLNEVNAKISQHSNLLSDAVNNHTRETHHHTVFWFVRFSFTRTNDTCFQQQAQRGRLDELRLEEQRLRQALQQNDNELLSNAIDEGVIEQKQREINTLQISIDEEKNNLQEQEKLSVAHAIHKAYNGRFDSDTMSKLIMEPTQILQELQSIRSQINKLKLLFEEKLKDVEKLPPVVILMGMRSALKIPVLTAAWKTGSEQPLICQSEQYQRDFDVLKQLENRYVTIGRENQRYDIYTEAAIVEEENSETLVTGDVSENMFDNLHL